MGFNTAPKLTNAGKTLYYKNLAGTQLKFTIMKIGDGTLASGQEIAALTDVIHSVLSISAIVNPLTTSVAIEGSFTNEASGAFYFREIGCFAADPDYPDDRTKDILYCYVNAYDQAQPIPAASSSLLEKYISVPIEVGDVNTVTCITDPSVVYSPVSHGHGNIDRYGKLGSTTGMVLVTDTGGLIVGKPPDAAKLQVATDALTIETVLADEDAMPFYDASAQAHRKTTWANILTKAREIVFGSVSGILKSTAGAISKAEAGTDYQEATQTLSAETILADDDSLPFYDKSASAHRRTTWANLTTRARESVFGSVSGILKSTAGVIAKAVGGTDYQEATQTLTAETSLADADTLPFYDASVSGHRKTTWSNILDKIRTAVFGTSSGVLKADGSGAVSAATEGTDYYKPGGTDVKVADGGTGGSDAATARQNLDAQQTTNSLTVATDVDDADTLPYYDNSVKAARKMTWATLKSVLKTYFSTIYQATLTFDASPTANSENPVKSGGVYTAIQAVKCFEASATAPTDTTKLWIDTTATTGGLKYYNGSAWVAVPVQYT